MTWLLAAAKGLLSALVGWLGAWLLGRRRGDAGYLKEVARAKDKQLKVAPADPRATAERLRRHRF